MSHLDHSVRERAGCARGVTPSGRRDRADRHRPHLRGFVPGSVDRRGVSLTKVDAQAQRFKVTGRVNEEAYFAFYAHDELRFLTRARRAERHTRPVTDRAQYGYGSS